MNHPGRGRWDRRLSRGERHAAQRAAILDAAGRASALHGRGLTLSHIVDGAGVGRNTFYDHFTDVESAIREAEARRLEGTTHAMERAARAARTPIEQLRSIVRAWTAAALEGPGLA